MQRNVAERENGIIHVPTVMQRNVAVKEPGPGGVKLTPAASGSGPATTSRVGSQTTTTVPAAIGPINPMAIGPRAAIGPIERKAHIQRRRLAYDDDGTTNGRKALASKLIVRTQKRLPQVGLRLDNEARR